MLLAGIDGADEEEIIERDAIPKLQFVLQWNGSSHGIIYEQRLLVFFVIKSAFARDMILEDSQECNLFIALSNAVRDQGRFIFQFISRFEERQKDK